MSKCIGVKPSMFGQKKREHLFFDKIGVPIIDVSMSVPNLYKLFSDKEFYKLLSKTHQEKVLNTLDEIKWLEKQNMIIDIEENSVEPRKNNKVVLDKSIEEYILANWDEVTEFLLRKHCLALKRKVNCEVFPIGEIKDVTLNLELPSKKVEIVNLVLNKLPIIDEDTPWENIIEFKKEHGGLLSGLRTWISEACYSSLTVPEIEDKIDYLLDVYRKQMEIYEMKFNLGMLETAFVSAADIVENLARLQFGKVARTLISFRTRQADLLEAELKAEGRELAYIFKAQNEFGT